MSTESSLSPATASPPAPRRRSPLAWIVAALVVIGFVGWFGVRMRAALRTQNALAAERAEVARAAAATPAPSARAALLVTGRPETWQPEVELEGTLQPVREADLGFKVQGRLHQIRVKLGDHVSAGQTLATLDDTEARAQVAAAEAQVRAAEAQLALAEDSARRTSTLVGSGAAAQATGVQTSQQRSLAAAQVDSARAQLQLAQAALANHALVAPFAGAVTRVPSGAGAIVNPGTPLFHLQDTSVVKLSSAIGEADAALVKPGAPLELELDGRRVPGRIVAVLSSVDPATRRVPVEAEIKNDPKAPLLGGAFVRAAVMGLAPVKVLRLPASALRPGSQNELVVAEGGRLRLRHILFSRAADGALLVRSGLAPTEKVLATPSPEAQDGDPLPGAAASSAAPPATNGALPPAATPASKTAGTAEASRG